LLQGFLITSDELIYMAKERTGWAEYRCERAVEVATMGNFKKGHVYILSDDEVDGLTPKFFKKTKEYFWSEEAEHQEPEENNIVYDWKHHAGIK